MWYLTPCKTSVSLSFLNWIKNEMIFYHISELMLATLIHRYDQKSFHFITKTRLFEYIENFTTKNWKFSDKNSDIFHISAQKTTSLRWF